MVRPAVDKLYAVRFADAPWHHDCSRPARPVRGPSAEVDRKRRCKLREGHDRLDGAAINQGTVAGQLSEATRAGGSTDQGDGPTLGRRQLLQLRHYIAGESVERICVD